MPVTAGPIPRTPDGDETWDPGLRAVLDLVLASPVAMALALGERFTLYYNSAYADLLGDRHPAADGRPVAEVFPEAWPDVSPTLRRLIETGEPAPLPETVGEAAPEPALPERGMSAVRDARGRIAGVLVVAAEPAHVADRLRGLGELAAALAATLTLDDVARVALGYALDSADVDQVAFGVDDGTAWRVVRRIRGELLDEADERLPRCGGGCRPTRRRRSRPRRPPVATVTSRTASRCVAPPRTATTRRYGPSRRSRCVRRPCAER